MNEGLAELLEQINKNQIENNLGEEPKLTKNELAQTTSAGDYSPDRGFPNCMTVYTSGSTGERMAMPYHRDYLDHTIQTNSRALKLSGMTEEDNLLVLGAPFPHMSGWAFREAAENLGADVANHSFEDFKLAENLEDEVEKYVSEVTCLVGLPHNVGKFGRNIEQETGSKPADLFEVLSKGFFVGDMLTEERRSDLKDQWGLEYAEEIYASTETDIIGCSINEAVRKLWEGSWQHSVTQNTMKLLIALWIPFSKMKPSGEMIDLFFPCLTVM